MVKLFAMGSAGARFVVASRKRPWRSRRSQWHTEFMAVAIRTDNIKADNKLFEIATRRQYELPGRRIR